MIPMKMILLPAAFIAALIPFASAQDSRLPQSSLDREMDVQLSARAAALGNPPHTTPTPPNYCKPCLFYAGDFDSNASDANGMSNEVDLTVFTGAAMYTPFIVPKGKTWTVTGLFTVNFMSTNTLDPRMIPYEVRKHIPKSGGSGGQLVCHGRKPGSTVAQGFCDAFGFPCFATIVNTVKGCRLTSGKYWMSVVPYCTNKHDPNCETNYRAFLTNDDGAMNHRFGPLEPANNSFFNSKYFGANWDPSSKWQTSSRFSVGVEGTSTGR
jgi:hypothetical protein